MCGGEMCGALSGETESCGERCGDESGEPFIYIHTFFCVHIENKLCDKRYMIYYWRSERYMDIIDNHNDIVKNGYPTPSGSDYEDSDSASCGESSDSSLQGRLRWRPGRFSNYGSRVPKKYKKKGWRL